MSKVIKPHEMILKAPVFIEILGKDIEAEVEQVSELGIDSGISQVEARAEADKIMRETEEMIVEILEKARLEAHDIMAEAQEEAQDIRLKAKEEAEVLKQQALDNGYQSGWNKVMQETQQQIEQASQQSKDLLEEANRERLRILGSCESIMVRLSMDIAQKIVEKEITLNPDIIIKLVKNIREFMKSAEAVKVLVSPEDFETLVAEFAESDFTPGDNSQLHIMADKSISRGGCMVETDLGSVDARLETRVSTLENALMEVVNSDQECDG